MIVRYGGGNDGIVDYLINGRKAERQYTRDELDHRVVLDGDLQTTDKIIDSIENKVRNVICTLLCLFMKVMCRMKC